MVYCLINEIIKQYSAFKKKFISLHEILCSNNNNEKEKKNNGGYTLEIPCNILGNYVFKEEKTKICRLKIPPTFCLVLRSSC